jgi:hypothetical protein
MVYFHNLNRLQAGAERFIQIGGENMNDSTEVRSETPPHLNVNLPETFHYDPLKYVIVPREEWEGLQAKIEYYQELLEHQPEERKKKRRGFWGWFFQRPAAILMALMMVSVLGVGGALGLTGNDYLMGVWSKQLNLPDSARVLFNQGYVLGVVEGFAAATTVGGFDPNKFDKCAEGKPLDQIRAIVEKYLADHPEQRHYPMAAIIWTSMVSKCTK